MISKSDNERGTPLTIWKLKKETDMKLIPFFITFFIVSCASMQVKRELAPDNIFISTNPSFTVQFDPSLQYKGTFKFTKNSSSKSGTGTAFLEKEYHIWINKGGDAGAVIIYSKLPRGKYWFSNIFTDDKNVFEISKEGPWQTRFGRFSPDQELDKKTYEMGLDFSSLNIDKSWAQNFKPTMRVIIIYAEKSSSGENSFKENFLRRADQRVSIGDK